MSAEVSLEIAMAGLAHVTFHFGRRSRPVPGLVVKALFDDVEDRTSWTEFRDWMETRLSALGSSPAAFIARGGNVERVRRHLGAAFPCRPSLRGRNGAKRGSNRRHP
jgi:hypothetical protein